MKIENVQLVTHLGCHKFNEEKKMAKKSAQKWLRSAYHTYKLLTMCRSLSENWNWILHWKEAVLFVRIFRSLVLPCYGQMQSNMCLQAITVDCRLYHSPLLYINSYPSIFLCDSFWKNHSVQHSRSQFHYEHKRINTLFLVF